MTRNVYILTLLSFSLLLTACSSPSLTMQSHIGPDHTVTIAGSQTLRSQIKQILRDNNWTIIRLGRTEQKPGLINDCKQISDTQTVDVTHYLDIAAYQTKPHENPELSIYRCKIKMFGKHPDREIFQIQGLATQKDILNKFRSALNSR